MWLIILGYFSLVLAIFALMAIYIGQFQVKNETMRNAGIGILIISLMIFGASKIFGDTDTQFRVSGVRDEYEIDNLGKVNINGKFKNVDEYNKVIVSVEENKKMASDAVIATVKPWKESFEVTYTPHDKKQSNELILTFKDGNQKLKKTVVVKPEKNNKHDDDLEATVASEKSQENSPVEAQASQTQAKLTLDSNGLETFKQLAPDVIDSFNSQVEKDALKSITVDPNAQTINVVLNDKVKLIDGDKKNMIATELGKRVVGLYRGTLKPSGSVGDLPIHATYQDGSEFGDSTRQEALLITQK